MENIEFKAKVEKPSKVSFLQKIPSKIKSPKILIYALLLVSLPTSVLLVKTVQDIRQRASGLPATPPIPMTYVFNQSAKLLSDPVPHYFVIPSNPLFDLTKDITLEAWIKPDSSNLNSQNNQISDIITRHDGDGNAYGLQYTSRKEADGTYSYSYNFSIADKKINCAQVTLYTANVQSQIGYHVDEATLTKWKHVAAVKNGNTLYVFENGKLVASRTDWIFQSVCTQDNPISIGARLTGNGQFQDSFFYGEIDEARISNIARYTSDFPTQPEPFKSDPSTVALYHFDKNLDDASGNNLYGKVYGAIQYPDSTIKIISNLTPTPSPAPTCTPRPACLDATPRCMIPELESYCPPTVTPTPGRTTPTPTPQIYTCGSSCSSNSQCSGICSTCSQGKCTVPPTPTYILSPTPTPASTLYPDLTIDTANGGGLSTSWKVGSLSNPVNVKFRIINQGSVPASAQYIYTNQSEGYSTLGSDNTCTASTILSPGKSCVSSYNFVFKSYGTKYFTISIDPYNQIKESVESNNIFDTKVLLFQMSPTPAYGTPPITPRPTLQPTPTYGVPKVTPTPTPAPKMCPASLNSVRYLDSCRYLLFSKGAKNIEYTCSDKYKGKISVRSCTSTSELGKQASAACAKRRVDCSKQ